MNVRVYASSITCPCYTRVHTGKICKLFFNFLHVYYRNESMSRYALYAATFQA